MMTHERSKEETLENIEQILKEFDAMTPEEQQAEMMKISTPAPGTYKRLEWYRELRRRSLEIAMQTVTL